MKWIKAALIGAVGSLVMFIILFVGIHVTGFAPFNVPPSAAFLQTLGLNVGPLPLVLHFGMGMAGSLLLVAGAGTKTDLQRGLGLATALWLIMMLVHSPITGWGVFGFGGANHALDASHPLYLGNPVKYVVLTLVLHLVYGAIIGPGNAAWTLASAEATEKTSPSTA
jgi:hypothetical protein